MLEFCIHGQTQDSLRVNKVVQLFCKVMFKFNSESPCRCFKIPTPTITSREQKNLVEQVNVFTQVANPMAYIEMAIGQD